MFERGGAKVAVIGQAFPYTPIANPRWMIANWSFGIREEDVQASVDKARKEGADLVVLLSHNGFDVDRKLASRVKGIDVVLTGHTHDALPQAVKVGNTLLIASGSHGKFLTRVDLDVRDGAVKGFRSKLIPIFSDVIAPQAAMAAKIQAIRAPHEAMLGEELGRTETLLYRRGNFNGTLDDMICDALLAEREAEIALSPGFRWGTTLLPGQPITREDVFNATAITYPAAYRTTMTGARLKEVLEDVADNLFNEDPYYQQGGDIGASRRRLLRHRHRPPGRPTHLRSDAPAHRQADRGGGVLHRGRLGERQRGHRGAADLGRRGRACPAEGNGEPDAGASHRPRRLIAPKTFTHQNT